MTESTAFLFNVPVVHNIKFKNRRGAINGTMIIGIVFAVIMAAALLPTGIDMWVNVTKAGGVGADWSTPIKTVWNVAPIMIVIVVVAGFVAFKSRK